MQETEVQEKGEIPEDRCSAHRFRNSSFRCTKCVRGDKTCIDFMAVFDFSWLEFEGSWSKSCGELKKSGFTTVQDVSACLEVEWGGGAI